MDGTEPHVAPLNDLTDALARGRLCLAELAHITPDELQAWSSVAIARLETGRGSDAAILFSALVTMFPYSASYWRNLGVALHRTQQLPQAAAAYRAALVLDPDHGMTLCYLAEILLSQGDERAEPYLQAVEAGVDTAAANRARTLLRLLHPPPPIPKATPEDEAGPEPVSSDFALEDGRTLPLAESRYSETAPGVPRSEAVTDRLFVTADDHTDTAVVAEVRKKPAAPGTGSITAQVDRRAQWPTALERRRRGPPLTEDITLTDIQAR